MRFKMAGKLLEILVLLCFAIGQLNAFYLPGLAPVNYCKIGKETETCEFSRFEPFVSLMGSLRESP